MFGNKDDRDVWAVSWKLSVLLSVLIHMLLVGVLVIIPGQSFLSEGMAKLEGTPQASQSSERSIRKVRAGEKKMSKEEEKKPVFMKTSPAQEALNAPKKAPYIGARPSRASGGSKAPDDIKELPAQDGVKPVGNEVVLFDQSRQDGALEHDASEISAAPAVSVQRVAANNKSSPSSQSVSIPLPQAGDDVSPVPPSPENVSSNEAKGMEELESVKSDVKPKEKKQEEMGIEMPQGKEFADSEKVDLESDMTDVIATPKEENASNLEEKSPFLKESLVTRDLRSVMQNERVRTESHSGVGDIDQEGERKENGTIGVGLHKTARKGAQSLLQGGSLIPASSKRIVRPIYDPAFSPAAQPGFKTEERKTRTTGRFSFGRNPSADVTATPMGRYQEVVYRAIGVCWYAQCDLNRDLIVTGTLRVRLVLNPTGKIASMRLMGRSGASVAQNSFTFLAIRQAPIPPMPPEVRRELVGDQMELFFDFNF